MLHHALHGAVEAIQRGEQGQDQADPGERVPTVIIACVC
jgi:hypothetical protein